jgi:hypothetical protein
MCRGIACRLEIQAYNFYVLYSLCCPIFSFENFTKVNFFAKEQGEQGESMMDKDEILNSDNEDEEDDDAGNNSKPDS